MKTIRRRWMSSGEVALTSAASALVLLLLAVPASAQVRVATIGEAIERWTPATHVYVMGEVGLEPAALAELESSLAGGHWTVLLVEDAEGQTFQAKDGVTREGVDAIEYGTGQGIARAAGFAAQVHPKTGEPDGTILSIVLAQRALYYTGSSAQDSRGLGERAFPGNLDRWAIAALRNGEGVAAAVRGTVTNVDGLLTAEIERVPREARAAAASQLEEGWRKYRALRRHALADEAAEPLERARVALVEGETLYRKSDPADLVHPLDTTRIDQALQALSQAEEAIAVAQGSAAATATFRALLLFLGLTALLVTPMALLLWRLGDKREAEQLLASWETALDRKLETLFGELERKVERFAAPASEAGGSGRGEETEALAAVVRADVGALVILWTSARSVLEKARQHIRPQEGKARLVNLFSARHYRKGIALLRDEPVPFDPAEGLPRLFGEAEHGWRDDLLGDLASYQPFRKSFEELMGEFHARAGRATGGLDDLEAALTTLPEIVGSLGDRARALPVAEAALAEARRTMDADPVHALRSARRAGRALELAERLPQVRSEMEAGERRIAQARQELGATLGLAPESLLQEADQNPSERLARAARQADAAQTALGSGDLDGAGSALEQANLLLLEATALVDRTLEAGRSWEREAGERRAETERLAALLPEHETLALRLRQEFGQTDQTLASGGMTAARDGIEAARRDLDAAAAALREGRALGAVALLGQVGAHQEQAGRSLAEIKATLQRLREEAAERERRRRERLEREEREREEQSRRAAERRSSSASTFSSSSSSSGRSSGSSHSSGGGGSSSGSGRSSWGSSGSNSGRSGW